mmetsp:Transcript_21211/g.44236  ORF Transcript_21211/g.44236 Transcript_21211/m.44236 type:complete len:240 (-) Transcript_21211:2379-3098(-)
MLRSPGDMSGMEGIMDAPSLKFSAMALRTLVFSNRPPNASCSSLAVESNFSSSEVVCNSSSTSLGKSAGRSMMAFLRSSGRSDDSCSDFSNASFGARSVLATVLANALSTSARRRRFRVAASPNLAASSTNISWSVDPSLSRMSLANSLAAAVRPSPSRSTVAVAAVYEAKLSVISSSFFGERDLSLTSPFTPALTAARPRETSPEVCTIISDSSDKPSIALRAAFALGLLSVNNLPAR